MKEDKMEKKLCQCCKIKKWTDEFSKDRYHKTGLRSYCKKCANKKSLKYKKENPDKVNKYSKKWYKKNRQKCIGYRKKWLSKKLITHYPKTIWIKRTIPLLPTNIKLK